MEKINSYYGLAKNDMLYAKAMMPIANTLPNYNGVVFYCAQSAEKYMKSIIEIGFSPEDLEALSLLKSHNLRAIRNKIITKFEMAATSKDCK